MPLSDVLLLGFLYRIFTYNKKLARQLPDFFLQFICKFGQNHEVKPFTRKTGKHVILQKNFFFTVCALFFVTIWRKQHVYVWEQSDWHLWWLLHICTVGLCHPDCVSYQTSRRKCPHVMCSSVMCLTGNTCNVNVSVSDSFLQVKCFGKHLDVVMNLFKWWWSLLSRELFSDWITRNRCFYIQFDLFAWIIMITRDQYLYPPT